MSSKLINKPIADSEWEFHKDTIKSLYLTDNLKLKGPGGLIAYMTSVHTFIASESQYESRLRKWGFYKNRSRNAWKSLGKRIAKRKSIGKASDIYMDGKLVSTAKVQRQITRYGSPPTLIKNFQGSSPRTPEGFTIRTPEADLVTPSLLTWTNNLPFFQLETNLAPEFNFSSTLPRNTEFLEFIDPKILHSFDNNALAPVLRSRSIVEDSSPNLHLHDFRQVDDFRNENTPNYDHLVEMLKSMLPKSVLDNHLALHSSLTPFDEGLKSLFSKIIIFSAANSFVQFPSLPMNMTDFCRISMDTGILQRLQHTWGPESEALAENLFLAAIEAQDSDLIKLLLLNTGLDCNELICTVHGRHYTPVERSSVLGSIEVTKHLINAQADVNKTFGNNKQFCGALELAIVEYERQNRPDIKLVHMLLQAGAKVDSCIIFSAIAQKNLDLTELLINYAKTSHADLIKKGILREAIMYFDNASTMHLVTTIIQAGAFSANDICPAVEMSLMVALDTAAEHGSLELVRFLLSSGGHITTDTLSVAIKSRKDEVVQFILSCGAKPIQEDLDMAVKCSDSKLVQSVLNCGVCPTPETLSLAIKCGSKEVVQSLLDAGADVDSLSKSGITPLAEAIRLKDGQIIEVLGLKGAWSRITEKPRFTAALNAASEVGEIEIVRRLLSLAVNFEASDLGWPLQVAIHAKHNAIAEMLLDAGADAAALNTWSNLAREPPLIEAIRTRNSKFVWSILEAGADVNASTNRFCDDEPITPLLEAVKWGDQTIIRDLIASGADPNASSTLALSVQKKDAKVMQILLDAGANVNHICQSTGTTALYEAVKNGNIEMTEILLSNGSNPTDSNALLAALLCSKSLFHKLLEEFKRRYRCQKKGFGSSALIIVILKEDFKLMEKLLAFGLDPNAFLEDMSILGDVIQSGDITFFESRSPPELCPYTEDLISFGWDPKKDITPFKATSLIEPVPHLKDLIPHEWWNGDFFEVTFTALGLAITKDQGKNISVVQTLLEAGGDPNSIVYRQSYIPQHVTALLAAIKTKNLPVIQLLIKYGAEINRPAMGGVKRTPLQQAVETGCFGIVQSLLCEKASVNAEPAMRGGGTALQLAAIGGWVGIAELLLNWGADPNAPASKVHGRNAVEGAAEYGRTDMLRLLFNAGAKVDQQLFDRSCTLAVKNGHFTAKKFLECLYFESLSWEDSLDI